MLPLLFFFDHFVVVFVFSLSRRYFTCMITLRCTSHSDIGGVLDVSLAPWALALSVALVIAICGALICCIGLSGIGICWVHWRCIRHWDTSRALELVDCLLNVSFIFLTWPSWTLEPFACYFFFFSCSRNIFFFLLQDDISRSPAVLCSPGHWQCFGSVH